MRKVVPIALAAVIGLLGCTKDQALTRAATALDVVQASTDVAWTLAVESSLKEQGDYVAGLERIKEAGGVATLPPEAEVRAHITEIRARWLPRFLGFRAVRLAHAAAIRAYEAYAADEGAFGALLAAVQEMIAAFGELQSLLGDIPGLDFELPEVPL